MGSSFAQAFLRFQCLAVIADLALGLLFLGEEELMRYSKFVALPVLVVVLLSIPRPAHAQVSINIGAEPDCPYGYYDLAPYDCAPYGYYGPEWFNGGVFIGAGPWVRHPRAVARELAAARGFVLGFSSAAIAGI